MFKMFILKYDAAPDGKGYLIYGGGYTWLTELDLNTGESRAEQIVIT